MGITFVHIDDTHQDDLESLGLIADIAKMRGLRNNDIFWVKLILNSISSLYYRITKAERQSLKTKDERTVKEFIRQKLESDDIFTETNLLTVELEPQNKHLKQLGFYDIKIRSSLWNNYFSFECKCIDNTQFSILEYSYNPNKTKKKEKYEDGGVYRFLINKYSTDLIFGGMIGFVKDGDYLNRKHAILDKVKNIKLNSNNNCFGELSDDGILETDSPYYFQSTHSRYDVLEDRKCDPIKIHHFLYDFTK